MKTEAINGIDVENEYCLRLNGLKITVYFAFWLPYRIADLGTRVEKTNDIFRTGVAIESIDETKAIRR